MNFEDAIENTTAIPDQRKESLIRDLRRYSDFSWLVGKPNEQDRLQGDILRDFPVAFLKPDLTPLITRADVLLLNNSCDLNPGRVGFVSVAPVLDAGRYLARERQSRSTESYQSFSQALQANQKTDLLFIGAFGEFREGAIVPLDRICSVPASVYESLVGSNRRLASFTQNGYYVLLMKLIHHFARTESDEVLRSESVGAPISRC